MPATRRPSMADVAAHAGVSHQTVSRVLNGHAYVRPSTRDRVLAVIEGLLAGIAGAVFSARSNGAQPGAGNMFELDVIAACFIGGASTTGGVGRVTGAMVGGLVMAVMSNGMQLLGISQSTQQVVKGIVLLFAVAYDIYNKRRAGAAR